MYFISVFNRHGSNLLSNFYGDQLIVIGYLIARFIEHYLLCKTNNNWDTYIGINDSDAIIAGFIIQQTLIAVVISRKYYDTYSICYYDYTSDFCKICFGAFILVTNITKKNAS